MSSRKTTLFYVLLTAVATLAVSTVIFSRLGLTPASSAQTIAVPPMNSAPLAGPIDASTFRNIAKSQSPMVVNIRTEMKAKAQDLTDFFGSTGVPNDFLHRFFGDQGGRGGATPDDPSGQGGRGRRPREQKTAAAGTGFIISSDGLILTNNHVVEDATKIEVGLYADDPDITYAAKIVGRDPLTDSALIQLTEKPNHPLQEAKFGDSSQVGAGDWVMAIGNPFGYGHTVTVGVISATQRIFTVTDGRTNDMLQTDAAINPGNSGGPLLNVRGEVIGINTAIITDARSEGNIGIGFAVPINTVRELLPQLRQGKVVRGRIGVQVVAVRRDEYEDFGLKSRMGAVVNSVTSGGPAAQAGIEPGDVIIEYNGHSVPKSDDLVKMVVATKPGTTVPLKVLRNKQEKALNVTVIELDLEAEQAGRTGRLNDNRDNVPPPEVETGSGFGLTLQDVTPQIARRLQLPSGRTGAVVTDVDPSGPAAAAIRPGDIIEQVNHKPVANKTEAARELAKVASGHYAQVLLWREPAGDTFVTIKKD
jgi:serine protease Do